ncbi:acetate/propionate family kinase [Poseidonibacter ostreae]|jgi:acetate kinase|uniref:Acetate kinase n=1 Tax=Poseidonibacter ostreae TaxID=2654171 RepID=A0A6L4WQM9_9BACT|nr:acetate kinase [Poseidonibacter ostreae]KAB7884307.1 acetate/propionate family kinase [Poseidonibacter ostreae]KAB7886332.1 acetate/propionate family kinase [Poseidonibacter ostreae]KAB7889044.1 acetate/propionate family kinase [Poseidonibacter ostreae]MAC82573.1 acetate kinase [Arcobacter sp.]|tara:strand:- start:1045 stop:2235 length:1191 start_codon:yes stop_codon:yes gene_type:complete
MLVFILNAGSSSLKYQLMNPETTEVLASGLCERIGIDGKLIHESNDKKIKQEIEMPTHKEAIEVVLNILTKGEEKVIDSISQIDAIGHRVVHGGEFFNSSVIVNDDVITKLEGLIPLAPLHNPANIMGIKIAQEIMPGKPNVAVFDTAFHQTMPASNYMYAVPYEDYKDYGVRKYGFHGTSHYYVSNEARKMLNKEDSKVIVCHLGNGSSICAVRDGKSIDTSMGLTPLEGLVMGTRSGDIDAGVLSYLMEKKNMTAAETVNYLNKKSGLLGVSGISSDLREIIEAAASGNERAQTTIDMKCSRIRKYICSYAGSLEGVDAICFTAGIGENADLIREKVCDGLEFMGVEIDSDKNKVRNDKNREINKDSSKTKIYVIPTNEELVIAQDTYKLTKAL